MSHALRSIATTSVKAQLTTTVLSSCRAAGAGRAGSTKREIARPTRLRTTTTELGTGNGAQDVPKMKGKEWICMGCMGSRHACTFLTGSPSRRVAHPLARPPTRTPARPQGKYEMNDAYRVCTLGGSFCKKSNVYNKAVSPWTKNSQKASRPLRFSIQRRRHNYTGRNYTGPKYTGHNYKGHNYICHNDTVCGAACTHRHLYTSLPTYALTRIYTHCCAMPSRCFQLGHFRLGLRRCRW